MQRLAITELLLSNVVFPSYWGRFSSKKVIGGLDNNFSFKVQVRKKNIEGL